jgi:hypothetical protein
MSDFNFAIWSVLHTLHINHGRFHGRKLAGLAVAGKAIFNKGLTTTHYLRTGVGLTEAR